MNRDQGILVVLEGSDGSGKTTQFNLLSERLKAAGYEIAVFDFPRYDKPSSHFVKEYLNGRYGPAAKISPYTASLFYALDRYEAAKDINAALEQGKLVLCNRYVGSNMAHQGAKFSDPVEQRGFFVWEDNLEFQLLGIPRPNANLFLRVPAEVSYELIKSKQKREYTSRSHDEHEGDIEHLQKSVATYDLLCDLFPKDFQAIDCTLNGKMLGIPQISDLIWQQLKPILPAEKPHNGHKTVVTLSQAQKPESVKDSGEEFSNRLEHAFKNASLYLKLQIERQIRSIEPAGLTVWSDNDYRYFTPIGLSKEVKTAVEQCLDNLVELHKQMRQKLESFYEKKLLAGQDSQLPGISDILLPATPLSAMCDFTVRLSKKAVERVCAQLLASDSPELQWAAQQLYFSARQKWPEDFSNPLESAGDPEPINNIMARLSEERLSLNSSDNNSVKLLEALPRQEFDLLAESIYPYSSLSLDEISNEVSNWSYQQKYDSLKQSAASPTLLEKVTYKFDIISDQILINKFSDAVQLKNLQIQSPSPRFGYDVPTILEDAGIDDTYLDCFDESLKLYSILQQAERDDLIVYAALLGHKLRWQFSVSASDLKQVFEFSQTKAHPLTELIRQTVAETHPLIWDVLANIQTPAASGKTPKHNRIKPQHRRRQKPKSQFRNKNK